MIPQQNSVPSHLTLHIATGSSRTTKRWKNEEMSWQELKDRIKRPTVTQETLAEYQKIAKDSLF